MLLSQKVASARKKKGLTQEELADLTKLTVRTIQRIENDETAPRLYTLKTIAAALDTTLEDLQTTETGHTAANITTPIPEALSYKGETKDFLQLLCLSCFSYLVIPFVHFLLPLYLLKKKALAPQALHFARSVVKGQIYWVVALHLLLLFTLAYNLVCSVYWGNAYLINYLVPLLVMYGVNGCLIFRALWHSKRIESFSAGLAM